MRGARTGRYLDADVDRGGREGASRREARRVVLARQPADHRHAREERQGRAEDGDHEGLAPHLRAVEERVGVSVVAEKAKAEVARVAEARAVEAMAAVATEALATAVVMVVEEPHLRQRSTSGIGCS